MIKSIITYCEYIKQVDSRHHDNQLRVELENVDITFIARLDTKDIHEVLDAIGVVDVEKWMEDRGKEC